MTLAIDRNLLQRAVDGDAGAINALVRTLRPHIERQLRRYPVGDQDRDDLVQTTLMQVLRRLPSFRGDSPFTTWLFRVTANEALMMMRSQRRHRARVADGFEPERLDALPSFGDGAQGADASAVHNQRAARVRQALDELTEEYRDVVIAHYHLDLGLQEIADRFALSEAAVRSRIYRARARLRAMLEVTPLAAEVREESMGARRLRKSKRAPATVVSTVVSIEVSEAA